MVKSHFEGTRFLNGITIQDAAETVAKTLEPIRKVWTGKGQIYLSVATSADLPLLQFPPFGVIVCFQSLVLAATP